MTKERLMYLLYLKNQINNRRKRFRSFLSYFEYETRLVGQQMSFLKPLKNPFPKCKLITRQYASEQYTKCQTDAMKLTPEISKIRKALNIRIDWGSGGFAETIYFRDSGQPLKFIRRKEFKAAHDKYVMDQCVESMLGRNEETKIETK